MPTIPDNPNDSSSPQFGLNADPNAGFSMSPTKALQDVKLQTETTNQAVQNDQTKVKEQRNNLTNGFLDTLGKGAGNLGDYNYVPNELSLTDEQRLKIKSIKNQNGLSDLQSNNPGDILKAFKMRQEAQYNNQFTPIDIQPYTKSNNVLKDINGQFQSPNSSGNYDPATIQSYIDKYSSGKAVMTANDFVKASQESGVGVDALLTQARLESQFGTTGRGATYKNPLNYGNDDSNNNMGFNSYADGLTHAAKKLKSDFGQNGSFTADGFIKNNFQGKYGIYATDPDYSKKYSSVLNDTRGVLKPNQTQMTSNTFKPKDTLSNAYGGTAYVVDNDNAIAGFGNPLKSMSISSPFDYRTPANTYNIGKNGQQLNVGIDLTAKENTPFYSVSDGKVVDTGTDSDGNKKVTVLAPNGVYSQFNHINDSSVKIGQTIKQGQQLGVTGATGNVTGSHLDFALYQKDDKGKYYYIDSSRKYK